jgi:hypothetical protein
MHGRPWQQLLLRIHQGFFVDRPVTLDPWHSLRCCQIRWRRGPGSLQSTILPQACCQGYSLYSAELRNKPINNKHLYPPIKYALFHIYNSIHFGDTVVQICDLIKKNLEVYSVYICICCFSSWNTLVKNWSACVKMLFTVSRYVNIYIVSRKQFISVSDVFAFLRVHGFIVSMVFYMLV